MPASDRLSTGVTELDELLGGGLVPGTLTVVAGATGIGKTQLGLHFADRGIRQEGERGIIFDMTARGDSQHQDEYALRLFRWNMTPQPAADPIDTARVWDSAQARRDYLQVFDRTG